MIRLRASRKLEEIFSSSLEGDELESAIASIPKRLDKFEGRWDQLLDWADEKYGKGDRKSSDDPSSVTKGDGGETNVSGLGILLLLFSMIILIIPTSAMAEPISMFFPYLVSAESGYSVGLLEAREICSHGLVSAFSGSVCSDVRDAFVGVVGIGLLGIYLIFSSVGRGETRSISPQKSGVGKFCSNCGKQFSDSENFCSNCGAPR